MKFKIAIQIITFLVIVYLILMMVAYVLQDRLVYLGSPLETSYRFNFDHLEQEVFLKHENGDSINGLYFKAPIESKGVILYFHGNAGNLSKWGMIAEDFVSRSYDVFVIDYRGYGKSTGDASEKNLKEDGELAYQWLQKTYDEKNIILYGRSLGSGVASYLSARKSARLLVLESPFSSIPDVAKRRFPYIWQAIKLKNNFSNIDELVKVKMPIYVFHGSEDRIVPIESSLKLKDKISAIEAFTILEGIGHHHINQQKDYWKKMDEIL